MSDRPKKPANLASQRPAAGIDPVLVSVFLICMTLVAGYLSWRALGRRSVTPADFDFRALTVDAQKLHAERDAKFRQIHLDRYTAQWDELLTAARTLNRAQFDADTSPEDAALLMHALQYHANEIIPATGYAGFVAAGQPLRDACQEGITALLAAVQAGKISLQQARENPPPEQFSAYRDNCGKMLPMLITRGLVTPQGTWQTAAAPAIADISARYRWAHIIADQRSPWMLLTPYEARIFARWRIEEAQGYSTEKRLEFLAEYAQLFPKENTDFARGVLAFRADDLPAALKSFERLAAAQPGQGYEDYVAFLKQRSAEKPQPPATDRLIVQ